MAGTTNVDRLSQMLDNAAVAFLVLTVEDEKADRTMVARQNAGPRQSRRSIVVTCGDGARHAEG